MRYSEKTLLLINFLKKNVEKLNKNMYFSGKSILLVNVFIFSFLIMFSHIRLAEVKVSINDLLILLNTILINMYPYLFLSSIVLICFQNEVINNKIESVNSIYVAGAWIQRHNLQLKMDELRNLGYSVTSNWPLFEERKNNPDDYAECSRLDIDGVMKADTIVVFMTDPNYSYRGTFTEIGCEIGTGKRIILICDGQSTKNYENDTDIEYKFTHQCMENVFFWDPRIKHVSTFEDAKRIIKNYDVISPYKQYYSDKISDKLQRARDKF